MNPLGFLGSLIGSVGSLVGGLFGQSSAEKIAQQNIAEQQLFAQQGLQWRAADATKAQDKTGINRLALLGVPTNSFSNIVGDNSLGEGISKAGADISRSMLAASGVDVRAQELERKLVEAKIANVNADTVRMLSSASGMARLASPGVPPPMPEPDPRGPVINLMQRARDPRTGEIVWIPSEKAASPLQTLAASSTNAALAGRSLSEGLLGFPGSSDNWGLPGYRPDVYRNVDPASLGAMY